MTPLYTFFAEKILKNGNILIKKLALRCIIVYMAEPQYKYSYTDRNDRIVWSSGTDSSGKLDVVLYEFDNLVIEKQNMAELTRSFSYQVMGPAFVLDIYESQYFHFLYDGVAQYLWLREFIPDLKLYFINNQSGTMRGNDDIKTDFVRNIVTWFQDEGSGGEVISLIDYKEVVFDKLFVFRNSIITFLVNALHINDEPTSVDITNHPELKPVLLPNFKDFVTAHAAKNNRLPEDFVYPKKVYLRPGLTMQRLQRWKDQLDYLIDSDVVFDEFWQVVEDPNGALEKLPEHWEFVHSIAGLGLGGVYREIDERYISPEDLGRIEDFFIDRDYLVLDSLDYSWIDILNMVMRAEKVALVAGAASLTAMMAPDTAQIIYLNPDTRYSFDHVNILRSTFKSVNPIILFEPSSSGIKKHEVQFMMKSLAERFGELL